MNILFWILVLLGLAILYFVLSFVFGFIGNIFIKLYNKFNKNIGKREDKNNE